MRELESFTAANRFGLGARPADIARIAPDPRSWLTRQIEQPDCFQLNDPSLPGRPQIAQALTTFLIAQRDRMNSGPSNLTAAEQAEAVALPLRALNQIAADEILARTRHGLQTDSDFAERLTYFWSNHFTVAATKATTIPWVGLYEREVIRANLTGRFSDLLIAMAQHPGMLLYLDQAQSIGPNSLIGLRRNSGLNENLAREILELHTVGVQSGYSQTDVTELAKALTGWTIASQRTQRWAPSAQPGDFVFIADWHEPGARTVLGQRYPEGGEAQGRAILLNLARHPATARRIAQQLACHFVADEPPVRAIEQLETAFLEHQGDLIAIHKALIDLPEAWSVGVGGGGSKGLDTRKFKSPSEFLLSSLRMLGQRTIEPAPLRNAINLVGQPPFRAPSPAGWPDRASHWAAPDAVMKRLEWSQLLADRLGNRERPEDRLAGALGPALSAETLRAIRRAESQAQGLVLALMSPEFQRR
jgi:uncharacterized protein (DUF1800 family)